MISTLRNSAVGWLCCSIVFGALLAVSVSEAQEPTSVGGFCIDATVDLNKVLEQVTGFLDEKFRDSNRRHRRPGTAGVPPAPGENGGGAAQAPKIYP